VHVTWAAVPGASSYIVNRHTGGSSITTGVAGSLQYDDNTVVPGNASLYRVMPVDASHVQGYYGNDDLATVFAATDDPVVARTTRIKAVHVQEVRAAIDKARALVSLAPFAYSNAVSTGSVIRMTDFAQMQNAANDARLAIGIPRYRFTYLYSPDATILAAHMNELRQSIR
jgi:hypothetical protein